MIIYMNVCKYTYLFTSTFKLETIDFSLVQWAPKITLPGAEAFVGSRGTL